MKSFNLLNERSKIIFFLVLLLFIPLSYPFQLQNNDYKIEGRIDQSEPLFSGAIQGVFGTTTYNIALVFRPCTGTSTTSAACIGKQDFTYADYGDSSNEGCIAAGFPGKWISSGSPYGYQCCGDDGNADNGVIIGDAFEGKYRKNYELCINCIDNGFKTDTCPKITNQFSWQPAVQNPFVINTAKRSDKTFDVISNSEQWFTCDPNGKITEPVLNSYSPLIVGNLEFKQLLPAPLAIGSLKAITFNNGNEFIGALGGSSGGSEYKIVKISDFEKGIGATIAKTNDDKDGDGYCYGNENDANAANPLNCPYGYGDCDDTNSNRNPGVEDFYDGFDADCSESATEVKSDDGNSKMYYDESVSTTQQYFTPRQIARRFTCYDEEGKGTFAECCGYDLKHCRNYFSINPDLSTKARRQGSVLTTIDEFTCPASTTDNCVRRIGFPYLQPENACSIVYHSIELNNTERSIKDWSNYESLELYLYISSTYLLDISILGEKIKGDGTNLEDYAILFNQPVANYVVNGPDLKKWLHVVIPISEIRNPQKVEQIWLFSSCRQLREKNTKIEFEDNGVTRSYNNIIGIDKIFLKPKNNEIRFCSAETPTKDLAGSNTDDFTAWIKDLDDNTVPKYYYDALPDSFYLGQEAGRFACEDTPSYKWTGTKCCGDDNTAATKEFYSDTTAGCFEGNAVGNQKRATIIEYEMNGKDYSVPCFSETCTFPLEITPVAEGKPKFTVINKHPLNYELAFTGKDYIGINDCNGIECTGASENEFEELTASQVSLQVVYQSGNSFYGCVPEDYIVQEFEKSDTPLYLNASCTILGKYFCDYEKGWSDKNQTDQYNALVNATQRDAQKNNEVLVAAKIINISANGCCPADYCWDGSRCVADQTKHNYELLPKYSTSPTEGFRCISGEWKNSSIKLNPDASDAGFCAEESQCFYSKDVGCMENKTYLVDDFCDNGQWSSRTKMIALQMLGAVSPSSNYTLFCDNYKRSLNEYSYPVTDAQGQASAEDRMSSNVNNFCVLKYFENGEPKTALGVSLYDDLNSPASFLNIIGESCRAMDETEKEKFANCHAAKTSSGKDNLSYNEKIKSLIYSETDIALQEMGFWQKFRMNPIVAVIDAIVNVIKPEVPVELESYDFVKANTFNRIYLHQIIYADNTNKTIYGIVEKRYDRVANKTKEPMTVIYGGTFTADICSTVFKYRDENNYMVSCQIDDNGNYVVFSDYADPRAWLDLTAKTRIK